MLLSGVMIAPVGAQAAPTHQAAPKYSVLDLGTLGGPTSRATDVNRAGVVVGASRTSDGSEHAFVWNPVSRRMRDLGTLGVVEGQDYSFRSEATGINDRGQIVGNSCADESSWRCIAFLWDPRARSMRPLVGQGANPMARAINNRGVVVGGLDFYLASWWTEADGWQAIDDPSRENDGYSIAMDINDRGQIAGLGSPEIRGPDSGEMEPFVFDLASHRASFIADYGCCGDGPVAVNERGQVAANGFSFTGSPPFVWDTKSGKLTWMSQAAQAADINAWGLVVGTLPAGAAGASSAFLWNPKSGVLKELKGLGGPSVATAVNNSAWIVGSSSRPGAQEHAVVWRLRHPKHH